MVKNSPANAGDARVADWIPGSERSPGGRNSKHSYILAWRIPWTEEPGGHSPWDCKESNTTEHTHMP